MVNRCEESKHLLVFRLRHGKTKYLEQSQPPGAMNGRFDLEEEGIMQIRVAAATIASRIDLEHDVVCVVSSPSKRARDSAYIVREYLKQLNGNVWDDSRLQRPQHLVRNFDMYDTDGSRVDLDDSRYRAIFRDAVYRFEHARPATMQDYMHFLYTHPLFVPIHESLESVAHRTRRQLTRLVRIARYIQPQLDQRIVIVQAEHCETLEDMFHHASSGEYSSQRRVEYRDRDRTIREIAGTGARYGEVIEVIIPCVRNMLGVTFLDRDETKPRWVGYNHRTQEYFSISENEYKRWSGSQYLMSQWFVA